MCTRHGVLLLSFSFSMPLPFFPITTRQIITGERRSSVRLFNIGGLGALGAKPTTLDYSAAFASILFCFFQFTAPRLFISKRMFCNLRVGRAGFSTRLRSALFYHGRWSG